MSADGGTQMEKHGAKQRVWKGITFGELQRCLDLARNNIGSARSRINPSLTTAHAHKIFTDAIKGRDAAQKATSNSDELIATNILREFGDFLLLDEEWAAPV